MAVTALTIDDWPDVSLQMRYDTVDISAIFM